MCHIRIQIYTNKHTLRIVVFLFDELSFNPATAQADSHHIRATSDSIDIAYIILHTHTSHWNIMHINVYCYHFIIYTNKILYGFLCVCVFRRLERKSIFLRYVRPFFPILQFDSSSHRSFIHSLHLNTRFTLICIDIYVTGSISISININISISSSTHFEYDQ